MCGMGAPRLIGGPLRHQLFQRELTKRLQESVALLASFAIDDHH
jgi:hypothetical protein